MIEKLALAGIFMALPSVSVYAAETRYFVSPPTSCRDAEFVGEWRISDDLLEVFWRRVNENRYRDDFEGMNWPLDQGNFGDESLVLSDRYGNPYLEMKGLGSPAPQAQRLDNSGAPHEGCDTYILVEAEAPLARYEAFLEFLSNPVPAPGDAMALYGMRVSLPPINYLPDLDRASMQDKAQQAQGEFRTRFEETTLKHAAEIGMPDADSLPSKVADYWVADAGDHNRRKLLVDTLNIRAKAMMASGADISELAVKTPEELCRRVDTNPGFLSWDEYLLVMTGLPLGSWSREIAQGFLDMSQQCENGDNFRKIASEHWPDIERRLAGVAWLKEEAERIREMELTLQSVQEANWLTADRSLRNDHGVSEDEIAMILEPALETRRKEALEPILAEMMSRLKTDAGLEEFIQLCDDINSEIGYVSGSELYDNLMSQCEVKAADRFKSRAEEIIEADLAKLESAPRNREGLKATNGFTFGGNLDDMYLRGAFAEARDSLDQKRSEANAKADEFRNEAITVAMKGIEESFAAVSPESEEMPDLPDCSEFSASGWSKELFMACQTRRQELVNAWREYSCELIWDDAGSPEDLMSGTIEVPSLLGEPDQVPIRKLVCNGHDLGIELVRDRGLFSSSYRLSHTVKHNDEDLTFSAELVENDTGGKWGFQNAVIEPGELNPDFDLSKAADILSCIEAPQMCLANP